MFLSDTHLPQLLTREQYLERPYFDREIERAFLPAWHMVGTTADLPRDGDFLKFPLLGREIIVWRTGSEFRCFLNVCTHRKCAIVDACSGHSPERLRCQYHGWEFDQKGNTRKIPDAPEFRPLTKGSVSLTEYKVDRVGQLLFVSLAENPKTLKEFLGPAYDLCADRYSDDWKQVWAWNPESEGNWKLAVEVTLEGYHVVAAHEKTLGQFPLPTEDMITHRYADAEHCEYESDHTNDPHKIYKLQRFLGKLTGWPVDLVWYHYHAFPHFGAVCSTTLSIAQCVFPVAPNRNVNLYRIFTRKSPRRNFIARGVARMSSRDLNKLAQKTLHEDRAVIAAHHRGLAMVDQPQGGLISRREERVIHFQKYIQSLYEGLAPGTPPRQPAAVPESHEELATQPV